MNAWLPLCGLVVASSALLGVAYSGPMIQESLQCLHGPAAVVEIIGNETVITYLSGNEQGFIGGYMIVIDGEEHVYDKDDWKYLSEVRFPHVANTCSVYAYDLAIQQYRRIGRLTIGEETE